MSTQVWINGKLFDKLDAKISVYDHGLLYGDGVFEGIRVYNGKVFKHAEHIARLYDSAKAIHLKIPMSPAELTKAVEETVKVAGADRFFVRDPDGNRVEVIHWAEPYDPATGGAARLDV